MIRRVLVGVDFSTASREALAKGAAWAARLGVPLEVLHVIELPRYPTGSPYAALGDPGWFKELRPQAEARLKDWAAPYPGASWSVETGHPAEAITERADRDTLIVVGQIGHSRLEHLLFGSTAVRVARHAPGDVLVVRAPVQDAPHAAE
ncbi:MAG TPA: universal stress protein [Holophagaceae bacterium]|nr:universal stress protein [Holophagaceae bacterium]